MSFLSPKSTLPKIRPINKSCPDDALWSMIVSNVKAATRVNLGDNPQVMTKDILGVKWEDIIREVASSPTILYHAVVEFQSALLDMEIRSGKRQEFYSGDILVTSAAAIVFVRQWMKIHASEFDDPMSTIKDYCGRVSEQVHSRKQ